MNVTPMTQNQVISGLVIQFSDSGHVRCAVNRISSAHAYYTFDNITGDSGAIKAVKQKAINVSKSNSSVVIMGESGTGKELFAQAIHNESLRKEGPFVAVNCASIPPELIASELFGYVEGAFTGARKGGSMGKFEYAHHGSLFLDEIGELPLYAQAILLRVLQERIVTRVGSNIAIPIDVRLISATNKNLRKMMKEGTFRSDLYFRIQVIPLYLPPLRERITDLPLHINYYLDYFNDCLGKNVKRVSPKALFYLLRYPWPGNLRELRNFIEYSINNAVGNTIELEDLSGDILEYFEGDELEDPSQVTSREKEFCTEERKKILRSLLEHNGNKSKVAEVLGIARSTLYHKIKEYKLD
jgi:transcriptional regulator with PAS, ATPase and Fis domain